MNLPVVSPPITAEAALGRAQAERETLDLLEWPRVCQNLADFASTRMGGEAARTLSLPASLAASQTLLARTVEMAVLDDLSEGGLSFRGVQDLTAVSAHGGKNSVGALSLDNSGDRLPLNGLDIGRIGHGGIRHDSGGVGVHEDDAITLFAQGLTGLCAGIIKLAGLTDDNRPGAQNQNALDIRSTRHALALPTHCFVFSIAAMKG